MMALSKTSNYIIAGLMLFALIGSVLLINNQHPPTTHIEPTLIPTVISSSFTDETVLTDKIVAFPEQTEQLQPTQPSPSTTQLWTPITRYFDGVTMVLVPAGCFMMGSTPDQAEQQISAHISPEIVNRQLPQHEICFDQPFWIDKYEVTQGQFRRFEGTKVSPNRFVDIERPVEMITWYEANAFCQLRGGRLPTEAEWEYAARGTENLIYPWGNYWHRFNSIWFHHSLQKTNQVGGRPLGASWVGALDMAGNVAEFTRSIYQPYPYSADDGRENLVNNDSIQMVTRGGSWRTINSRSLYVASRDMMPPNRINDYTGFRCVRDEE